MIDLNKAKLQYKDYEGTLVLFFFDVVIYEGVVDREREYDDDFYHVLLKETGFMQPEEVIHLSPLISITPLKGKLSKKDYNDLVNLWNKNNPTKAK